MSHAALLYRSQDHLLGEVVPFICAGLQAGARVLVVAPGTTTALLRGGLGADAASVDFADALAWYATPARALQAFADVLRSGADGPCVHFVAEQVLEVRPPEEVRELCACDAAANAVLPLDLAEILCVYDARTLPPEAAAAVPRTHPVLLERGRMRRNEGYVEPAAFLRAQHRELELPEPDGPVARLASPRDVGVARRFVADIARALGLGRARVTDLVVAANEVVTNALVHGQACVVRLWRQTGRVVCEVRDRGPGIQDPLVGYHQQDGDETGGRGLWLARHLVDLLEVRCDGGGTTVRLHVRLQP